MSRIRVVITAAVVFVVGAIVGGGAVGWAYSEFLLQPAGISAASTEAATNLAALRFIREGKTENAVALLETVLDGNLICLDMFPEDRLSKQTFAILGRAAAYRKTYPYTSSDPSVNQHISEMLAKHRNNAPQNGESIPPNTAVQGTLRDKPAPRP